MSINLPIDPGSVWGGEELVDSHSTQLLTLIRATQHRGLHDSLTAEIVAFYPGKPRWHWGRRSHKLDAPGNALLVRVPSDSRVLVTPLVALGPVLNSGTHTWFIRPYTDALIYFGVWFGVARPGIDLVQAFWTFGIRDDAVWAYTESVSAEFVRRT